MMISNEFNKRETNLEVFYAMAKRQCLLETEEMKVVGNLLGQYPLALSINAADHGEQEETVHVSRLIKSVTDRENFWKK